jgi:hypothetical protein
VLGILCVGALSYGCYVRRFLRLVTRCRVLPVLSITVALKLSRVTVESEITYISLWI